MPSCNLKLFHLCVAVKGNDLHSVQKWLWNRIRRIRRANKEDFGQIIRYIQVMICKSMILFRIQHFQKGACRISIVIPGKLIDLIKDNNRIRCTAALNSFHNPSRHGANIGSSVTSYLSFIPNSSQTDSGVGSSKCLSDTLPNTRLACSRSTGKE